MLETRRMPTQRAIRMALVAWPVVVALILGVVLPASSADGDPEIIRAVKAYGSTAASSACGGDTCVGGVPDRLSIDLPAVGTVSITVTLTISYQTTPGDVAWVGMRMIRGSRAKAMAPGPYRLEPSDIMSTTLRWAISEVGSGQRLEFAWGISARYRLPPFRVAVTKALLEVVATPV
jgi:hypothetical protein